MQYIATKNQNKKEDKHPDFRIYKKDSEGNVITEKYTNKDGVEKDVWKSFGAMWFKVENGKIKSASISIDDNHQETSKNPVQAKNEPQTEDVDPDDIPF